LFEKLKIKKKQPAKQTGEHYKDVIRCLLLGKRKQDYDKDALAILNIRRIYRGVIKNDIIYNAIPIMKRKHVLNFCFALKSTQTARYNEVYVRAIALSELGDFRIV